MLDAIQAIQEEQSHEEDRVNEASETLKVDSAAIPTAKNLAVESVALHKKSFVDALKGDREATTLTVQDVDVRRW